jgi:hypothetical protein
MDEILQIYLTVVHASYCINLRCLGNYSEDNSDLDILHGLSRDILQLIAI